MKSHFSNESKSTLNSDISITNLKYINLSPKNNHRKLLSSMIIDKVPNKLDRYKIKDDNFKFSDFIKEKESKNVKNRIDDYANSMRKEKKYNMKSYNENLISNIQF